MPRLALITILLCLAFAAPALGAEPLWTHGGSEPVRSIALSSDGEVVAVASDHLHIFTRAGELVASSWPAKDVAVDRSGDLIVAGTDTTVYAYGRDGSERWSRPNVTEALAVSANGRTVAALGKYGDLGLYDAAGGYLGTAEGEQGDGVRVAVSEDGSVVATACERGVAAFSKSADQYWAEDLPSPYAVAVDARSGLMAVGDEGSINLFDQDGTRVALVRTGGAVRSIAMASSGDLTVAGAGDEGLLALGPDGDVEWNRTAGGAVTRVAVSKNGSVIAAAAEDRTLQVYDRDGTLLWQAPLAGDPRSLTLSADGSTLVAGCDDGTVSLFEIDIGAIAAQDAGLNATAEANETAGANATAREADANGTAETTTLPNTTVAVNLTASVTATGAGGGLAESGESGLSAAAGAADTMEGSGLFIALPAVILALLAGWVAYRRSR